MADGVADRVFGVMVGAGGNEVFVGDDVPEFVRESAVAAAALGFVGEGGDDGEGGKGVGGLELDDVRSW